MSIYTGTYNATVTCQTILVFLTIPIEGFMRYIQVEVEVKQINANLNKLMLVM